MAFRLLAGGGVRLVAAAPPPADVVADLRRWRDEVAHLLAMREAHAIGAANDGGTPAAGPAPHFTWPADVDFHLTRTAARLSGEVAAGATWHWCSSGGLDVELPSGRMWLLSPSTAGRLREARLLPEMVATMRARP